MTSISKPTASSLSLSTKIGWGFADAGINVFVFLKSVMILNFMTTYLGVNALIAGVVTSLVILTDMITDPLVGAWSDRMDSRWGRRRPFMAIGAFLMLALTYGTFAVPSALTGLPAAMWVFVFYALASIGFTMVAVPFGAMATEMTENHQERVTMTGFRMAFASVGLLLSGLIFAPQTRADFAGGAWLIVGAIMVVPILVSVLFTRKAPSITSQGDVIAAGKVIRQHGSAASPLKLAEQLAIVFRSGAFLRHMIAYGIMTLSVSIISAGIRYITDDIVTSRAANGDFQSYLAEANLSESQQIRLGLMADANGGWTTRSGQTFDNPPVVFDVQNPAFDFNMVDYASLADHPYGQEQIGAVKSVLKGAVAAELSGPLAFLVNLAGLFSAVFALFLLGSILSQLLWVPLAGAIGRDRTLVTGLLAYGVLLGIYWFVLRSDNLNLIVALPFFLGVCNGCYQNLPWAILPTMIDKANQEEGRRVEGAFNGFWLTGQKIANALGPMLFVIFLTVGGYQPSEIGFQIQSEAASNNMEMLMSVLPAVFFLIAIPLFLTIPKALRR